MFRFHASLHSFASVFVILGFGAVGQTLPRREYEDKVAHAFEVIRVKNHLPKLSRIMESEKLLAMTCNAAVRGEGYSLPGSVMYRTLDLDVNSPELEDIAHFDKPLDSEPAFTRYAVAVWRKNDDSTGPPVYWVGVRLHWSALREYLIENFTDERYYQATWKQSVPPQCRGK